MDVDMVDDTMAGMVDTDDMDCNNTDLFNKYIKKSNR